MLRLKDTERRLSEALEFGQTILDASPVGIVVLGSDGVLLSANTAMATILGVTPEQLQNLNFRETQSWKASELLDDAEEVLSSGIEKRRDVHLVNTFGRDLWLDCRFSCFKSKDEFHVLLTANDITARKQAEEEKGRLIGELKEALTRSKR